ncbi:MAG TPA: tRNA preQ1(34) S-adenosylmethionine ribosyltransferase-isomerase QueA [Candidatus Limnocylindrales bacterium]|nr:tRNA preQ1(34) S-adenosylmethionine ribosyltransferase-isomerase QueA [Candidatus Limnocylindrales bacterium]
MLVSEFDYHLPDELIAKQPLANRAAARMLHVDRASDCLRDTTFREFPDLLRPDDLLVVNNTRVLPARLYGHRSGSRAQPISPSNPAAGQFLHGKVEVLLTRQLSTEPNVWEALVHPGRKLGIGERIYLGLDATEQSHELAAEIVARGEFGERHLRFDPVADFLSVLERIGHVPLPPYIDRPDTPLDREQYQTVYARPLGSVAAPTAGLHFTSEVLDRIRARGIETAEVTLHVGLGTFQPIRVEVVEEHKIHREWYSISPEAAATIQRARDAAGRRIVAVGTTTVRTLEAAARQSPDGRIVPQAAEAAIFIYPGFDFRVVGAILTNFHLPKSTLIMLASAFAGRERTLSAYEHAVRGRYRFYSYGDCMLLE